LDEEREATFRIDVGPVLRREVVEGQQHVPVLLEALRRAGVLGAEDLEEQVERLLGFDLALGHPDVAQPSGQASAGLRDPRL